MCAIVHIWWLEGGLWSQSSPATLFKAVSFLLAAALCTTYCPCVSGDFVSTFYLAIRVLGLQTCAPMSGFTWVLVICTQVARLVWLLRPLPCLQAFKSVNLLMMFRTLQDIRPFVYVFRITSLNTSNPSFLSEQLCWEFTHNPTHPIRVWFSALKSMGHAIITKTYCRAPLPNPRPSGAILSSFNFFAP